MLQIFIYTLDLLKIDWSIIKLHPTSNQLPVGCMKNVFRHLQVGSNELVSTCNRNVLSTLKNVFGLLKTFLDQNLHPACNQLPVGCILIDIDVCYNILDVKKFYIHLDLSKIDWSIIKLHPISNQLPVGCMKNVFGYLQVGLNELVSTCNCDRNVLSFLSLIIQVASNFLWSVCCQISI